MAEELFSTENTEEEQAAHDWNSCGSGATEKVALPSTEKSTFEAHEDDVMRIRDSIPDRKKIALEKELRLRKIIAQLKFTGYDQQQINEILNKHADKSLFDDIVEQYDLRDIPDPDLSDLMW